MKTHNKLIIGDRHIWKRHFLTPIGVCFSLCVCVCVCVCAHACMCERDEHMVFTHLMLIPALF